MKKLIPTIILVASVMAGCVKPASEEYFVREDQSVDGVYSFMLDMSDSLCKYDVYFYTKVDGKKNIVNLPVQIIWTSPSGQQYSEQVYMKVGAKFGDKELYRSSLVPVEFGSWNLCVVSLNDIKGLRGMGVIVESKDYGTRQTP